MGTAKSHACAIVVNSVQRLHLPMRAIDGLAGSSTRSGKFRTNLASTAAEQKLRDTGLEAIGKVPWGSHFCIFYETHQDLCDILVPYFKAGLKNHEACFSYVVSHEFRTVNDAKEAVRKDLPGFDRLSKRGDIEIVAREKVFASNGHIDTSIAIGRFRKKLRDALAHGFEGLRGHGSSAWLRANVGERGFCRYERELDSMLANQRMIVACTFPLLLTAAGQILDAART